MMTSLQLGNMADHIFFIFCLLSMIATAWAFCPSQCLCPPLPPPEIHVICINVGLTAVPGDIPSLTTHLYLSSNNISSIEAGDFDGLTYLETLDLSGNIIETIHNDAFQDLTILTNLFLNRNKLQSFGPRHVRNLRNLETLEIRSNPNLHDLEDCIFAPVDKLNVLHLSGSPVNLSLGHFGDTTVCNSYPCNALSDSKCHLPELAELDMSETSTDEVNVELFQLTPSLRSLSLARNEIETIPDDSFVNLSNLETLSLNYNNLTRVTQRTLSGLTDLTKLELGNRGLVIEPDVFDILPNLAELSLTLLGQTVIDSLAPSVATTTITKLNLHHNFLVTIPTSMSHIPTITSLDLSQNFITDIPEREFSNSLMDIDLSYNVINVVHEEAFSGLSPLKTLNLCYNELNAIPGNAFDDITDAVAEICLGANPWICNCTMLPIIIDPRSHDVFPYPQCSDPVQLKGRPFSVIEEEDLDCVPVTTPTPTTTPTITTPSRSTTRSNPTTPSGPSTTSGPPTPSGPSTPSGPTTTSSPATPPGIITISTGASTQTVATKGKPTGTATTQDHNTATTGTTNRETGPSDKTILSSPSMLSTVYTSHTPKAIGEISNTPETSTKVHRKAFITSIVISVLLAVICVILAIVAMCACKKSNKRRNTSVAAFNTSMPPDDQEAPPPYSSIIDDTSQITFSGRGFNENTNIVNNVAPIGVTTPVQNEGELGLHYCHEIIDLSETKPTNGDPEYIEVDSNIDRTSGLATAGPNGKGDLAEMNEPGRYATSIPSPNDGPYLIPNANKNEGNKMRRTNVSKDDSKKDNEDQRYETIPADNHVYDKAE